MGIDVTGLRALLYAKARGSDFSQTATLGRQNLHITPKDMRLCFRKFHVALSPEKIDEIFMSPFADSLLQHLGTRTLDSFDASSYQGATIIHDLNRPIPDTLKSRYSMVIDCGTLEHVFNFPVAVSNLIDLTAPGGHILSVVPANNFCGHGFYQFSAELFFRVFSRENGCEVLSIFLATAIPGQSWHEVTDPHLIHDRVMLQNYAPTNLIMLAMRRDTPRNIHFMPHQSDYEHEKWVAPQAEVPVKKSIRPSLASRIQPYLPLKLQTVLCVVKELIVRGGFRVGYRAITPETLAMKLLHRD